MKCQNCGLVNWADATECRRCKISFQMSANMPQAQPTQWQPQPQPGYQQPPYQQPQTWQQPYQQPDNQQNFYQQPQSYQQSPYPQQPPIYPPQTLQQPQSYQPYSAPQPPVYPPQSYQQPPNYQPNAYQQTPMYQPQSWQSSASKPKKKSFFSPPESREEALKVIKSSSYYYFFCTVVYLVLAVIMNPYSLIDAIFIGIMAGFLLGLKSRVAAVSLFVWSILTIISTFFVVETGSPRFNIVGFIIRIIVGIASIQATFAYQGKFNIQTPPNYAGYTPNNAASYGYSPGYTVPPSTNYQQNYNGSAVQNNDPSNTYPRNQS